MRRLSEENKKYKGRIKDKSKKKIQVIEERHKQEETVKIQKCLQRYEKVEILKACYQRRQKTNTEEENIKPVNKSNIVMIATLNEGEEKMLSMFCPYVIVQYRLPRSVQVSMFSPDVQIQSRCFR